MDVVKEVGTTPRHRRNRWASEVHPQGLVASVVGSEEASIEVVSVAVAGAFVAVVEVALAEDEEVTELLTALLQARGQEVGQADLAVVSTTVHVQTPISSPYHLAVATAIATGIRVNDTTAGTVIETVTMVTAVGRSVLMTVVGMMTHVLDAGIELADIVTW